MLFYKYARAPLFPNLHHASKLIAHSAVGHRKSVSYKNFHTPLFWKTTLVYRSTLKPRFNLGAQLVATFILGVVGRRDVGSGAVNYYGCAAGAPVWLSRPPYDIFKP